ncbi:MAG: ATP-binding protein [Actinomycetota bacterium]|nr:ATP-binding protein [Actinomycetota bacterium]
MTDRPAGTLAPLKRRPPRLGRGPEPAVVAVARAGRRGAGPYTVRSRKGLVLLDRLLHHASVVATEGESYRMKQAKQRGGRP